MSEERPFPGGFDPESLAQYDPVWSAPAPQWQDGLPLGNGRMGVMIWGRGPLFFTIAGDPMAKSAQTAGDVALVPKGVLREATMRLHLATATAEGRIVTGQGAINWSAWVHAEEPLLVVDLSTEKEERGAVFRVQDVGTNFPDIAQGLVGLGFPSIERGNTGEVSWRRQLIPWWGEYAMAWHVHSAAQGRRQTLWLATVYAVVRNSAVARSVAMVQAADAGDPGLRKAHEGHWSTHYLNAYHRCSDAAPDASYWRQVYRQGVFGGPRSYNLELSYPE